MQHKYNMYICICIYRLKINKRICILTKYMRIYTKYLYTISKQRICIQQIICAFKGLKSCIVSGAKDLSHTIMAICGTLESATSKENLWLHGLLDTWLVQRLGSVQNMLPWRMVKFSVNSYAFWTNPFCEESGRKFSGKPASIGRVSTSWKALIGPGYLFFTKTVWTFQLSANILVSGEHHRRWGWKMT